MTASHPPFNTLFRHAAALRRFAGGGALWLASACLLAGCTADPPQFRANLVDLKMQEMASGTPVKPEQKQQIADTLLALFGTPDNPDPFQAGTQPSLLSSMGFDVDKLRMAAGRVYNDENGAQHGLFRLHCAHCHGITGDGAGPTAAFLNPYPRDYRQGKYKFKSTLGPAEPTHMDLLRTLTEGIPGTEMPSFRVLPESDRAVLAEYVRYLSFRGQTELALIDIVTRGDAIPEPAVLVGGLPLKVSDDGKAEEPGDENNVVAGIAFKWHQADQTVIAPVAPSAEMVAWLAHPAPQEKPKSGSPADIDLQHRLASLERGRAMFYGKTANCFSCHGDSQLGDGQTTDYDYWFQWRKDLDKKTAEERAKLIPEFEALGALPPRNITPRDLRSGVYRGGRRPLDIYRRIFSGINGTPMPAISLAPPPAAGKEPDPKQGVQAGDIWDLVHYIKSLPYEPLSQPPVQLEGAIRKHQL